MGRVSHNYAASDGGGIGAISIMILLAGVFAAAVAVEKYRNDDKDNALILGASAAVAISMALGVLSK